MCLMQTAWKEEFGDNVKVYSSLSEEVTDSLRPFR